MLLGFDTNDEKLAQGAQLVYAIYRSRDRNKGPSGIDMWSQIERFARASAKRAVDLGGFVDTFKRKMSCGTINPRHMDIGMKMGSLQKNPDGSLIAYSTPNSRSFMTQLFQTSDEEQQQIIEAIYKKTQLVILLVRERLEREKPIEAQFKEVEEDEL